MDRIRVTGFSKHQIYIPEETWQRYQLELREQIRALGPCRWFQQATLFNIWDDKVQMKNDMPCPLVIDAGDNLITVAVINPDADCVHKLSKLTKKWIKKFEAGIIREDE